MNRNKKRSFVKSKLFFSPPSKLLLNWRSIRTLQASPIDRRTVRSLRRLARDCGLAREQIHNSTRNQPAARYAKRCTFNWATDRIMYGPLPWLLRCSGSPDLTGGAGNWCYSMQRSGGGRVVSERVAVWELDCGAAKERNHCVMEIERELWSCGDDLDRIKALF